MFKKFMLFSVVLLCLTTCGGPAFAQDQPAEISVADVIESAGQAIADTAPIVRALAEPVPVVAEPVQVIDTAEVVSVSVPWLDVSTPANLIAVMAAFVPVAVEIFIKPIPGITPWLIRLASLGFGLIGGLLVGLGLFVPVPYTLATSILCGGLGGIGFSMVKWGSQAARGTARILIAGMANLKTLIMLATVGILSIFIISCTAAQQQVWKNAGTTLGQCLAAAGVAQADDLVTAWAGGEAIDGAAIGWSALAKALPCFAQAGAVLVTSSYDQPGDSIGAAMVPRARMLRSEKDPLRAACGDGDVPNCTVILRR